MKDSILELAAFLLTLFCLTYSMTVRRKLYIPLPSGLRAALRDRHCGFLIMLVTVALSTAGSMARMLAQDMHAAASVQLLLNMAYYIFHNMLPCFLALYVLKLSRPEKKQHILFFLPLLFGQLLILTNPVTRLCFYIDESLRYHRGSGIWMLYAVAAFYAVIGILYYIRFGGALSKTDRMAALILLIVALVGVAVQALWSVKVEQFFEAVALFGCMVMLEREEGSAEDGARERNSLLAAIVLTFMAVILMNAMLIRNMADTQSDLIGNFQLDVIRGELQDTIRGAETDVLLAAIGAEQLVGPGSSREAVERYIKAQRESHLGNESFMNLYIAGSDWHIIPGFDAPPDYRASSRLWYLGAKDHPGEAYITEPYLDADTGTMCFTVSEMLSDGETVVAMDLNFTQAQRSIQRMTNGTDQTAMIVTSGGLIAGYTDMSLVGERADEKLPEYAEVLRRVTMSREHGSFRVRLHGRPCTIFSSETGNGWYLILAEDNETLYAESNRRIIMMTAVNLLMLVVIMAFYIVSSHNRRRTAEAEAESRRFINGISGRLRESAAQLQRLGDERLISEETDAAALAGQVREAGQKLSELVDGIRSFALLQREREREAERQKEERHAAFSRAPSRNARNGVIVTFLLAMLILLFFCVRISLTAGNIRMNQDADRYEIQLDTWTAQQKSLLFLLTDIISAKPELMEDYDGAVHLLNGIARQYPEISSCYLANPYAAHTIITETGWVPGPEYKPEERPWYRDTERSATGFSISAPYYDAETGCYCVTFSRTVTGETGEFLGIFGIDVYLDELVNVLDENDSDRSFAFLVDAEGLIISHPNPDYQMTPESSVSVEDTEYADAYNKDGVAILRDHTGRLVACIHRETGSGFTILAATAWWDVYGSVVLVTLVTLALFGMCIMIVVRLINRLILWQDDVNRRLVEAADAAVKADQAKSRFLAQMSHEIRTPMNAIIGIGNLALQSPGVSPQTHEQLEKINVSARHLLALINDILDMSRIESGRMTLKEKEFSFREFIRQIDTIIGSQCADKGLRFDCSAGQTGARFVGDELKLKQVLINILGNAVKFTDPPGVVTFTAEQTGCTGDTCLLCFTVRDTGAGMDKEFLPKLFDAFSQEDGSSTNRYGGSGLGMAISKNFVEMMGGEIGVESEKGLGTTFTVIVPLKKGTETEPQETAAEQRTDGQAAEGASLAGVHVLIAEDTAINAEILIALLEMEEVTSEWVENGAQAVERFGQSEENHFDAVLMDMRMPVMDGLAATRAIRGLDRGDATRVPIIALTANAFEEDVRSCLEAGMNAHLSKPVDPDRLYEAMRRLVPGAPPGG